MAGGMQFMAQAPGAGNALMLAARTRSPIGVSGSTHRPGKESPRGVQGRARAPGGLEGNNQYPRRGQYQPRQDLPNVGQGSGPRPIPPAHHTEQAYGNKRGTVRA